MARRFSRPNFNVEYNFNEPSILILKQKLKFVEDTMSSGRLRDIVGQFVVKIVIFFTKNVPCLIFAVTYLVFSL